MQIYRYVGPKPIADRVRPELTGVAIRSAKDVRVWVRDTSQELSAGCVTVAFVVNADGVLLVADRRSEHVICAGGQPVRSAGEITFELGQSGEEVEVIEVSNQSTGYCPEPESWSAVAEALSGTGLLAPDGFTFACEFRKCVGCGSLILVKHGVFECGECGAKLPAAYNVQSTSQP